jgi:hypothetical protein
MCRGNFGVLVFLSTDFCDFDCVLLIFSTFDIYLVISDNLRLMNLTVTSLFRFWTIVINKRFTLRLFELLIAASVSSPLSTPVSITGRFPSGPGARPGGRPSRPGTGFPTFFLKF